MSERNEGDAPELSPEERQELARLNEYVTTLNDDVRQLNHHLVQVATEFSGQSWLLSYFGKTTIAVACALIYRLIPYHFSISLEEIEKNVQSARDAAIANHQERLHSMPYADYLQTEHWQNTRGEALKRAHYHCQVCNATKSLQVHHRTYERRGYEREDDLIVLCGGCHQLFHDHGKLEVES